MIQKQSVHKLSAHFSTSLKVVGSVPDEGIDIFISNFRRVFIALLCFFGGGNLQASEI